MKDGVNLVVERPPGAHGSPLVSGRSDDFYLWMRQRADFIRTGRFDLSIKAKRVVARKELSETPSFKAKMDEIVRDVYEHARIVAAKETKLPFEISGPLPSFGRRFLRARRRGGSRRSRLI